jgi:hypothetical protein
MNITKMPTMTEVEAADVEQLARWYRFLLPTESGAQAKRIMDRIEERLKKKGGINENGDIAAAVSKKIGYGGV